MSSRALIIAEWKENGFVLVDADETGKQQHWWSGRVCAICDSNGQFQGLQSCPEPLPKDSCGT
jgi:hypothetical protein